MHLSRSMVATLAVIGAMCALPTVAASEATIAPPSSGAYTDTKASVTLTVGKDRKTIAAIAASCFVGRVQQGDWDLHKRVRITRNAFAFDGPIKVNFDGAPKTLTFKIRGRWSNHRFTGTATTSTPARCGTLRFSAARRAPLGD